MNRLLDWLDQRTGYRRIVRYSLYENIPGGARWRYIWGSTLVFTLSVQFITGLFLWMAYSPSSQTAWESVYYIQYQMTGGWLLRGIHHYTASVMNVLLILHLMQVVIDGAYKAPREINFWFGLGLLLLVLGLSLTGYLLPWDQKGYWATKVATNIAGIVPLIGPAVQRVIIGGADYGHHTLTRFFALHAGVLPALVMGLLFWHIFLFRRHGITAKDPKRRPDEYFWPDQVLRDAVACLAVLAAVFFLILQPWLSGGEPGAELGAPADPSETFSAARPEWYFLFLFEFLKYFPGKTEIWGAIVIPGLVMGIIFLMPIFGKWQLGHRFNIGLSFALLGGMILLTYLAMTQDRRDSDYLAAVEEAERDAHRVKLLAQSETGIPPAGAVTLLRNDSLTQGPKIFARNCAGCHRFNGHDGSGKIPNTVYTVKTNDTLTGIAGSHDLTLDAIVELNGLKKTNVTLKAGQPLKLPEPPSASDLKGFASRAWLDGLLDPARVDSPHYFGATKFKDGKMAKFVKKDVAKFSDAERAQLKKALIALSAEANLKSQRAADQRDEAIVREGKTLLTSEQLRCTECHSFGKRDEDATGPDLTSYGSRRWLVDFISDPTHEQFYGKRNDRMPAFGKEQILDASAIGLVADWLRGDWYEPVELAVTRAAGSKNELPSRQPGARGSQPIP